jgi:DNA primase
MRIPKGFADEVRQQADIVRVISDYVTLKKRGANYLALCPFHQEKTPSFNVHPIKQIFKCFGCGVGGSVFEFIMRIEGCEFPEAVRIVAEKSGIPIPRVEDRPELVEAQKKEQQWRNDLLQINRLAQEFFQQNLNTPEGQRAIEYLQGRGVRPETIRRLGIGYAPASWEALSHYLRRRKVSEEQIERSGLVTRRSDGQGNYDRFRGRIIFPITDSQGRIVAFGGRLLNDERGTMNDESNSAVSSQNSSLSPKYLNSPETAVYTKGRHLFGLSHTKEAIRRAGFAILVEGYLDFVIPYQEGIQNVVASLGTALTEHQVSLLKRFTQKIVVNFDPDPAGRAAAMRSLLMLIQHGFDVRVLVLPQGKDPDSYVRQFGVGEYEPLVSKAPSYLDFVITQATEAVDLNRPEARARALRDILPYVTVIPDRIERAASGDHVASRLMLDPKLVQDEIRREVRSRSDAERGRSKADQQKANAVPTVHAQITQAERELLAVLLNRPEVAERLKQELKEKADAFKGVATYPLFEEILACLDRAESLEYATLAQRFQDREEILDVLERSFMVSLNRDVDALYHEAKGCLASLECKRLEDELRQLRREMDLAQQRQDVELYSQLSMRKLELSSLLAKTMYR